VGDVTEVAQKTFDARIVSRRPLTLVGAPEEEG